MFTGIVEELGTVRSLERQGDSARLVVTAKVATDGARHGDSIAVNGVCLTVTDPTPDGRSFTADVMAETLVRTSLAAVRPGSPVNLERALPADARLGGHIVQGHVDGVGTVAAIEPGEHWHQVRIWLPAPLAPYVAEKGSIAVDGVSLTVTAVSDPGEQRPWFSVGLIPTTLGLTTLGRAEVGDPVNLEVDVIAKYVARLAGFASGPAAVVPAGTGPAVVPPGGRTPADPVSTDPDTQQTPHQQGVGR